MTTFPCLLITDLDNTLWDWFAAWHQSFTALLDNLVEMTGADPGELIAQIRAVHQHRSTVEYPNLVAEIPLLAAAADGSDPSTVFAAAVQDHERIRQQATRLYPQVRASLDRLRAAGVGIVAYTDSDMSEAVWRIRHTGLDGIIDTLYAPTGTDPHIPSTLAHTRQHPVAPTMRKPHPGTLHQILHDHSCDPAEAVYLGDSLSSDMPMAQTAGVTDVHAAYGMFQHRDGYQLLRQVSHWSDTAIASDTHTAHGRDTTSPTMVCHHGFADMLPTFGLSADLTL